MKKTERLTIRLEDNLMAHVKQKAGFMALSDAAYVRFLIQKEFCHERTPHS